MKRKDLIRLLKKNGFTLIRQGSNHSVYYRDGKIETVPRHNEINESLAKAIIKRNNLRGENDEKSISNNNYRA